MPESSRVEPPRIRGIDIVGTHADARRSTWFKGVQTMLDRTVAVKRLRRDFAGTEGFRDAFLDAGRRAANIVHPSALAIYNVFPEQDSIVMEWRPEPPLSSRLESLSLLETLRVGIGVLDGLAALHATGRSHGNLSPGNIFLAASGTVRISDFFQPAVFPDGSPVFSGDSRYIAPEVLGGRRGDWRSDLYALGTILREAAAPDAVPGPVAAVAAAFCAADPARRGSSPAAILEFFKAAARRVEERLGEAPPRPHRQYRRIPAEFSVRIRRRSTTPEETAAILSKIRDIGENGVFVAGDSSFDVGSIVELNFTLQDGGIGDIHAFGVVRWRSESPLAPGVGVQFVDIDEDGAGKLRRYIRRRATERRERT